MPHIKSVAPTFHIEIHRLLQSLERSGKKYSCGIQDECHGKETKQH